MRTRRDILRWLAAAPALALAGCGTREHPRPRPASRKSDGASKPRTGGRQPNEPVAALRTSWLADPYSLGAYSVLAPSTVPVHVRDALAEPVGRLFFAGEHTSARLAATTQGAYESGRRAADQVGAQAKPGNRVVVIGAGVAGLACAGALRQRGTPVHVLEARDRIGGRVWTVDLAGGPVDLGASWLHGVANHPLAQLATQAGAPMRPFDYLNQVGADPGGDKALDGYLAARHEVSNPDSTSVSALLPDDIDAPLAWAIASRIGHEFGADPEEIAVSALTEGDKFSGGDSVLPRGYGDVIRLLAADLDIQLGIAVRSVRQAETVTIETSTGNIEAEFVVVTVPIGVLKAGTITFDPPLPPNKSDAMVALGAGAEDKVLLAFDRAFWDTDADLIEWIDPGQPGVWAEWVNGMKIYDRPVLIGTNSGRFARERAHWSDRQVIADALGALRRMYP